LEKIEELPVENKIYNSDIIEKDPAIDVPLSRVSDRATLKDDLMFEEVVPVVALFESLSTSKRPTL
jgi:hypothetical protein